MNFNPYMAYGQGGGVPELPPARHPAQHFDPNGFYKYVQLSFAIVYPLKVFLVRLWLLIYRQQRRLPDNHICELRSL
jgi:hypothetical protein